MTEAVLLWERNKLQSLSEADPQRYYMLCTSLALILPALSYRIFYDDGNVLLPTV